MDRYIFIDIYIRSNRTAENVKHTDARPLTHSV